MVQAAQLAGIDLAEVERIATADDSSLVDAFNKLSQASAFAMTAAEFDAHAKGSRTWRRILRRRACGRRDFKAANHTFSSSDWRRDAEDATLDWLRSLPGSR